MSILDHLNKSYVLILLLQLLLAPYIVFMTLTIAAAAVSSILYYKRSIILIHTRSDTNNQIALLPTKLCFIVQLIQAFSSKWYTEN